MFIFHVQHLSFCNRQLQIWTEAHQGLGFAAQEKYVPVVFWFFYMVQDAKLYCGDEVIGKSLAQAWLAGSIFFHSPTMPIGLQGTVSLQLLSGSGSQVSFLCFTFQEREQYQELYVFRSQVITRKVSDIELF